MQKIELRKKDLDYRTREAYKNLRTNVEFSGDDIKMIAVTSCTPNEGKSSVSFELASSFAQTGKRVLLVDADLRKSVLLQRHQKGKVRLGLVHYLVGKYPLDEVICETGNKNLFMIFAGPVPPNPAELLGNKRFGEMVKKVREEYDIVIIDTPPLGSVIDSAIVAKQVDGVILVVANGEISYRFAQKVKEQLDKAGSRILGCVLNKVNMSKSGKYGYYGKYYGKYYGQYYGNY
ncbi:MAG: CpsD/CapB family tyrosine-protein kinase [Lachnospiraceae bacterium]|nr:CpsD/CapB family tyrosine-protein kinase [Lachnospiraceae bacterium]